MWGSIKYDRTASAQNETRTKGGLEKRIRNEREEPAKERVGN